MLGITVRLSLPVYWALHVRPYWQTTRKQITGMYLIHTRVPHALHLHAAQHVK